MVGPVAHPCPSSHLQRRWDMNNGSLKVEMCLINRGQRVREREILGRRDTNAGYDIKDWNNMLSRSTSLTRGGIPKGCSRRIIVKA